MMWWDARSRVGQASAVAAFLWVGIWGNMTVVSVAPPPKWFEPGVPVVSTVPVIAASSPSALPGETISLTGSWLAGATFELWADGRSVPVEPLRTEQDRTQVVVPVTDASGGALSLGPMWLRPVVNGRSGRATQINAPRLWWVWPREVRRLAGGSTLELRLFGRGLADNGPPAGVWLICGDDEGEGEGVYQLETEATNPYHIVAVLPDHVPPGDYAVRLTLAEGELAEATGEAMVRIVDAEPLAWRIVWVDGPLARADLATTIEQAITATRADGGRRVGAAADGR